MNRQSSAEFLKRKRLKIFPTQESLTNTGTGRSSPLEGGTDGVPRS